MTSATPSDALRANVMSRIAVEKSTRFSWRFVVAGSAIAGVALVAFAVSHRAVSNPAAINPATVTASTNPTASTNTTSPVVSVVRTAAVHDSGQLVFAELTDEDREWLSRSVPALERPELMTIKPLSDGTPVKAIDIEPIRVVPLMVRAIGDDNQ